MARVGRRAGALELQLPALAARVHRFAQADRAAVAQLTGPSAELVPAVVGGERLHALEQRVAAKHPREQRRGDVLRGEAKQFGACARRRRCWNRWRPTPACWKAWSRKSAPASSARWPPPSTPTARRGASG